MKYRKKPIVVDAIRYEDLTINEVCLFMGGDTLVDFKTHSIIIETLEGKMFAKPGDYIIKGVKGEFYPCKPDIFEQTYEKVED